jgi:hypothetical protein
MNDRVEINMIGGGFQHSPSTSGYEPLYVKWVKGSHTAPISMHIDFLIKTPPNPNTINYGWLSESKDINTGLYEWCANNLDFLKKHYKLVFTHDVSLTELSNIFALQVSGKSFIAESDGLVYPKTKLVSMIASNKKMCPAHIYRHEMIAKFSPHCDHFGRGFREIPNKIDGLKDYCFSIAMENGTYPNMVSEKITDCFMTGTIPIFYGIENIGDFFNTDGIITLNDDFKIESLSFDLYNSKIEAVKENFETAMNMLVSEDHLYLKYIKNEI